MAKGKTNQPLTFLFPFFMKGSELVNTLESQGHTVDFSSIDHYDVVFGPNCHMLTDDMVNQKGIIDLALRAARKRKKAAK